MITPKARLSWPHLWKPREGENGGKPKFSLTLIFDEEAQKDARYLAMRKAAHELALEAFGVEQPQRDGTKKRVVPSNVRLPFRDGAEKLDQSGKPQDGYGPGKTFVSASGIKPPKVVGGDNQPATEDQVYPGCYVRASVTLFAYDNSGNKGISFGLRSVQKMADGDRFGSSVPAFDVVEGYSSVSGGDFAQADAGGVADGDMPF
jgi:hypothetical protein